MLQPISTPPTPVRALVVENDQTSRDLLARVLRRHGCEADTAIGGSQALRAISRAGQRYDLLVTDLDMQPMDGVELLRSVAAMPPELQPPHLIVVSGCLTRYYAALHDLRLDLHLFQKPLHLPTFLKTLAAITPIPLSKVRRPPVRVGV